eukprot:m.174233 g.174233  ORF g.174233 m.174233 type:complete len:191 (-) comp16538_c2_seq3:1470-2042(-)
MCVNICHVCFHNFVLAYQQAWPPGGIISAIIFVIAWWLICAYLRRVYYADNSSHPRLWVWIVFVLQVIAAIGLVLLVIFDVDDHEGVHIVGAAMFFIATIIGDTVAIAAYYRHAQGLDEQIQRRAKFKLIVLIIIWVLFIIYVPIGYAVSSSLHGESRRGVRQMQAVVQFFTVVSMLVFMVSWSLELLDS